MFAADGLPFVTVLTVVGLALITCLMLSWKRLRRSQKRVDEQAAHERAEALLGQILSAEELKHLGERGYLDIPSPSVTERSYRVPRRPGRVGVVEKGIEIAFLCVAPVESMPPADVLLTHKLMIEGNEQEYLRRANHYLLRMPPRAPAPWF